MKNQLILNRNENNHIKGEQREISRFKFPSEIFGNRQYWKRKFDGASIDLSFFPKQKQFETRHIVVQYSSCVKNIPLKKICPLRGHILIARFARSSLRSQVWARLGRAIRSSHTFKFISYILMLKLKPIL